jgi:hypothetical protein
MSEHNGIEEKSLIKTEMEPLRKLRCQYSAEQIIKQLSREFHATAYTAI